MQDRFINEGRKLRLAPHHFLGLAPDARPNRVHLFERVRRLRLLLGHKLLHSFGGFCNTYRGQMGGAGDLLLLPRVHPDHPYGRSCRNPSTPALKTLSPTASMWSRPGISSTRAPG